MSPSKALNAPLIMIMIDAKSIDPLGPSSDTDETGSPLNVEDMVTLRSSLTDVNRRHGVHDPVVRPAATSPAIGPSTHSWTDSPDGEAERRQVQAAGPGPVVQLMVEIDGRVDQPEVGERLREVAQLLPGGPDLLPVQSKVVGVGQHLVEGQPGLV